MTRVVCDVGQPRRMETCGAKEPYEGNLHVRFCGGIGRAIANPTRTSCGVVTQTVCGCQRSLGRRLCDQSSQISHVPASAPGLHGGWTRVVGSTVSAGLAVPKVILSLMRAAQAAPAGGHGQRRAFSRTVGASRTAAPARFLDR